MKYILFAILLICNILVSIGLYSRRKVSANKVVVWIASLCFWSLIALLTKPIQYETDSEGQRDR